jgi:FAD-dependent urate hydroxylase
VRLLLAPVTTQTGQKPYPVARADLQALLMERFGLDGIHLGKKLVGIADDGTTVTATFADGTTDPPTCSSAPTAPARSCATTCSPRARRRSSASTGVHQRQRARAGLGIHRTPDGVDDVRRRRQARRGHADRRRPLLLLVRHPQPSGLPHDPAAGVAPLREAFGDWAPGVQELLAAIDPAASLNRVEIWDITPFDTWTKGRVAILGDAAHNTSPDIGQGACSALEDAFALGIAFATNTLGVADTLRRYAAMRVERAGELVLRARKRAWETHAFDPAVTDAWYESLRGTDGTGIIRGIVGNIEDSPVNLGGGCSRAERAPASTAGRPWRHPPIRGPNCKGCRATRRGISRPAGASPQSPCSSGRRGAAGGGGVRSRRRAMDAATVSHASRVSGDSASKSMGPPSTSAASKGTCTTSAVTCEKWRSRRSASLRSGLADGAARIVTASSILRSKPFAQAVEQPGGTGRGVFAHRRDDDELVGRGDGGDPVRGAHVVAGVDDEQAVVAREHVVQAVEGGRVDGGGCRGILVRGEHVEPRVDLRAHVGVERREARAVGRRKTVEVFEQVDGGAVVGRVLGAPARRSAGLVVVPGERGAAAGCRTSRPAAASTWSCAPCPSG